MTENENLINEEPLMEAPANEATVDETPATEAVAESPAAEVAVEVPAEKPAKVRHQPQVPGEFDWDAVDKRREKYSSTERSKLEAMYDKTLSSIGDHEVIDGVVVGRNTREVIVNIGFKSDGVIPVSEFRYNPNLKIGDKVEVYVENQEGSSGQLELSHKKPESSALGIV